MSPTPEPAAQTVYVLLGHADRFSTLFGVYSSLETAQAASDIRLERSAVPSGWSQDSTDGWSRSMAGRVYDEHTIERRDIDAD